MSTNFATGHNQREIERCETSYGGQGTLTRDNRRSETRYPAAIKVRYPRRNSFFFEFTRNISRGGMFIATQDPMEVGERFVFEMEIPGEEEMFPLVGEVRWCVRPQDIQGVKKEIEDLDVGMGVAFVFEDDDNRKRFTDKVMSMLYEAFGTEIAHELMRLPVKNR
jgi:type IV pilus assembly protein PilZ